MGTKINTDDVTNANSASFLSTLNENDQKLADEFDKVLYRDGSLSVQGDVDMDGNHLINLPRATTTGMAVPYEQFLEELDVDIDVTITSVDGDSVNLVSALKAIENPVNGQTAFLNEEGRAGAFVFSTASDYSSAVASDTQNALFIAPEGESGATGAWVRLIPNNKILASWFGVKGDGQDYSDGLSSFFLTVANNPTYKGVLPPGTATLSEQIVMTDLTEDLSIEAEGDLNISVGQGNRKLLFGALIKGTTTLTARANYQDLYIDVVDGSLFETSDLIYMKSVGLNPSPSRPYEKQCVRRCTKVDGNRVYIDQPLEFFFDPSENLEISSYPAVKVHLKNISLTVSGESGGIRFDSISEGLVEDMNITGPAEFFNTNTDPFMARRCDGLHILRGRHINYRYFAISLGSRRTVCEDLYFWGVRHIDPQIWAEDTLIKNCVSPYSQGIFQCHASVNTMVEGGYDCIDPDTTGISPIQLRCIKGSAKNCKVYAPGSPLGELGTTGIDLYPDYQYLYGYDRVMENVIAPQMKLNSRYTNRMIVRGGLYYCLNQAGYEVREIWVDDLVKYTNPEENILATSNHHFSLGSKAKNLEPAQDYGRDASYTPISITSISNASNAVVIAAGHGLTTGNVARIDGVLGMTEINGEVSEVTVIDANSFSLNDVDSTSFTAYDSGGKVTKQEEYKAVIAGNYPGIGLNPSVKYSATLLMNQSVTGTTFSESLLLKHHIAASSYGGGFLKFKVVTRDDAAEFTVPYQYIRNSTSALTFGVPTKTGGIGGGTLSLSISNANPHFVTQTTNEGSSSAQEYYFTFDYTLTTNSGEVIESLILEVDEYLG